MRVLFTTHPIYSHFAPIVPLLSALKHAGHCVAVASSGDFASTISAFGFEAVVGEPDWRSTPEILKIIKQNSNHIGIGHASFIIQNFFIHAVGSNSLETMHEAISKWKPDVVVSEFTEFTGRLIAEKIGIPFAIVLLGIELSKTNLRQLIHNSLDELRKKIGLTIDPEFEFMTDVLSLCFAPQGYQPVTQPLRKQTYVIRPSSVKNQIYEHAISTWLNKMPQRPLIYVTLGNAFGQIPGIFEIIIDALSNEPFNVIITVGRNVDPKRFNDVASNILIEQFIPNSLIIPRSGLVVSHAGYGTVSGALIAGIPMVLLPLGADHFHHAQRCKEIGVASIIKIEELTPGVLLNEVRKIIYYRLYKKNTRKWKRIVKKTPSVKLGVFLLEKLAQTGQQGH